MAPTMAQTQPNLTSLEVSERQLRNVIQTLFETSVTLSDYKPDSTDLIVMQISKLLSQYQELSNAKDTLECAIPREIVMYIEDGRNPDIYTREFLEIVVKQNQFMNGKMRAFQSFRDVLADQIETAFPELRKDVDTVMKASGALRKDPQAQGDPAP